MAIEPAAISARPAVATIHVPTFAPERPAASANGTVRPSAIPITTSRTNSLAVKWRSMWAVSGVVVGVGISEIPHLTLPGLAAGPAGVALEPVIQVVMLAAPPGEIVREEVRRDERDAPALDLSDVRLLVVAARVEAIRVPADDDVAERH